MSFIKELKRRNVIRVAVAYVVAAWLLLQVSDTLIPALHLPEWFHSGVALFLILGFPLALIFAWAYELTPEGLRKDEDVDRSTAATQVSGRKLDFAIIIALVLALAYFAYDEFVIEPAQETQSAQEIVATDIQQSIAVLPFVNMSPETDQEYFADGLSEEILNLLAKIPDLKVIGRTSSFAFKGKNEDLRVIGQTLGVTTVLEGSVRKSGDRVRVTAQLIDVSDGSHLWSETYDRTMTDIFTIQDDVASAIIDALQIHVGTKPTRGRPTDSTEAYALFFQARVSLNAKDLEHAEEILLKAVELDPNFAEAYELLAFTYWEQTGWLIDDAEGRKLMSEATARALAINPDLAFAQALFGSANNFSWPQEIQGLERALREEPGKTEVVEALVWSLLNVGYLQEALDVAEGYVDRDPLLPAANYWMAQALYSLGRTSEAVAAWELAAQLGHNFAKLFIGHTNLVEMRDDIGIAQIEASLQEYGYPDTNWVRELVTGGRDPSAGQAYMDRRIPQIISTVPAEDASELQAFMTTLYLALGYVDRYFESIIDVALDKGWGDAANDIWYGTIFRRMGFTAHPKYLEVAEANGFVELWEQRGAPDFCEKIDEQWVCE